jgi:hypothetical protein
MQLQTGGNCIICFILQQIFFMFSSVPPGTCRDSTSIRPRPFPSKSLPIDYLVIRHTIASISTASFYDLLRKERSLRRPRSRWENNMQTDFKEIGRGFEPSSFGSEQRSVADSSKHGTELNLRVQLNTGCPVQHFLIHFVHGTLSHSTNFYGTRNKILVYEAKLVDHK